MKKPETLEATRRAPLTACSLDPLKRQERPKCLLQRRARHVLPVRRGWAIDSTQTSQLVLNALEMPTQRRQSRDGLIMHSDRGVQFASRAYGQRLREAGVAPSMGAAGTAADNAMMESF